jgi:hypothetical protein
VIPDQFARLFVRGRFAALAVALTFAWPAVLPAQQKPALGEVAKKEQERRKTTKSSGKVLTTKDMPASAIKGPTPPAAAGEAAAGGEQGAQAQPGQGQAGQQATPEGAKPTEEEQEQKWRARITTAREELRRNEAFLEALQSRVNALTTSFYGRDDPYQQAKIGEDRTKALAEMERLKAEIEANKKKIDDIEEEARRQGVPPGWLR